MKITPVILAAGKGTRMNSKLPKVLHPLLGKPLVQYALDAASTAAGEKPVLVVGHESELIRETLGDQCRYVVQEPQLGTGHALKQAENLLRDQTDLVLVTNADMPLIRPGTLQELVKTQQGHDGPFTMLTLSMDDPRGFGRVIRDQGGSVLAIVEEKQATEEQLEVKELNASMYCFSADWLWGALERVELSPQGEYYLTDLVEIAVKDDQKVKAVLTEQRAELIGVNTRVHLAEAVKVLQGWINEELMTSGVSMIDPGSVYIESGVKIGRDTLILPHTHIQGETVIGEGNLIGPNTMIRNSVIGNDCEIQFSVLEQATVEDRVDVGPFSHLRSGAHLADDVHLGNFGEVKNSSLGKGTKMGHFSYLGDAELGEGVNIGAGTITCNYDGKEKHLTRIGDRVFVGSDTMLVAPVELGNDSRTGAGSVVTKDVSPGALAVGVPAREIKKSQNS